jgi:hypothetical protein
MGSRLTESEPSVTLDVTAPLPPGMVCAGGALVADCDGDLVSASAARTARKDALCNAFVPPFMDLDCSAFLFDSGACGGLPPGWSCPSQFYHGGPADGCDCNCGAWDPDCNDLALNAVGAHVFGCNPGLTCLNRPDLSLSGPAFYLPDCWHRQSNGVDCFDDTACQSGHCCGGTHACCP